MDKSKKRILVTGGAGFIGANLTKFLKNKNYQVFVLVKKNSNIWRLKEIIKNTTIYKADITSKEKLEKIIKKVNPDYIIHLASYGNSSNENDFKKIIDVNISGLINLLMASQNINYKKFIIAGSSSEYGFKNKPMTESDYLFPNSYYSAAKGSATLLAQSYALMMKKPIAILRLFSVYGPFEENNRFIPTIIKKALKKEKILVTKENVKRDFIYIDDVTNAFYKVMTTSLNNGEIINIGTGKQYSNKQVVRKIEKILNLKLKLGTFPKRAWDTSNWVANNQKAKKMLKWSPKFSIEEGLKKTVEWYKNN